MKKTIIILMVLVGMTATAQTGHLTFKGIPIDGTLNTFVSKLKQKGFNQIGIEQGVAILKGEFASFKGCMIAVSQHESGIVNRVAVIFPERDTWSGLYSDYSTLKQLLTHKYGEPSDIIEEFQGYTTPLDDNDKIFRVKLDKCKYICDFTTDYGVIELKISHNDISGCFVTLLYIDAENESKVQSSAIDDL